MAERRMFAKTIVLSDLFLDMPMSARCLYFTLGMFADDDGFVNSPKSIMRQCGASQDDMNILIAKQFVLIFDSGIIVITHWRLHNYIRQDTYNPTKFLTEKGQIYLDHEKTYQRKPSTSRGRAVDGTETQYSIGKDSIDKVSIDKTTSSTDNKNNRENKDNNYSSSPTEREVPTRHIRPQNEHEEAQCFMETFNSIEGVVRCSRLHATREILISTLFSVFEQTDIEKAFDNLRNSDWLRGKVLGSNGKPFQTTFDWFINLDNFTKVLEGNYNNVSSDLTEEESEPTPEMYLNQKGVN